MNKPIIEASCVVDDVEYHAVSAEQTRIGPVCAGCVAEGTDLCRKLAGNCGDTSRADRSDVIWVRAQ